MNISHIVIHDSDSKYGDVVAINHWHKLKGFEWENVKTGIPHHIGYHYVIYNGSVFGNNHYSERLDGLLVPGRPEDVQGAHCVAKGMNSKSLGICLIGPPFTDNQLEVCTMLVMELMDLYEVPSANVIGHKEVDPNKKDPRLDMVEFRRRIT